MNIKEAKKKAAVKIVIGVVIALPSIVSTVISFLKMIYYRLDDGTQFGSALARPFKQLVIWVYEHTQPLSVFWKHSPIPDHMNLSEPKNVYFIFIYMLFFVGIAFLASGKKLNIRIAKINEKIEDQLIEESIKGYNARSREQIEASTQVSSSSIFSQLHQLYLAPLVTAVIGAIIIKALGM
ncbi:YniB family protein [Shewanella sp. M-Br]|uniref:YniB family protein n=1 Tax=Shewanella sp. M-Br TaxID=2495595 RepID=UPI002949D043|nr:yfeABCD regulator yfeE [Shewanella sp. M-Br]